MVCEKYLLGYRKNIAVISVNLDVGIALPVLQAGNDLVKVLELELSGLILDSGSG